MLHAELLESLGRITEEERAILGGEAIDKSRYTDHGGFTIDNKKMLNKGKLIALRPHTRFVDFPRHDHNYIEIMYVCSGTVTHIIGEGRTITLAAGELLFMSCHTAHSIMRAGEGDLAINFIVLPQFFDKAYEMLDSENILRQFIAQNLRGEGGHISHLHFKVADVRPVQNLVENLVMEIIGKQPNRRSISQMTMALLILQLLNHTERIDMGGAQDEMTIAVLREIQENYRHASLTALAEKYGQSVYTLSKMVKRATGRTYKQVLQERRFVKAAELLRTTRLSVAGISAYVGYENISYFHRKFMAYYQMSPASYREAHFGK